MGISMKAAIATMSQPPQSHAMLAALVAAVASCGGHTLDVGSNNAPDADTVRAQGSEGEGGIWEGHFEDYQLQDGSDALAMTLAIAADATVAGNVLLGDGALLKPPTDADAGYPPGAQFNLAPGPTHLGFFAGFRYTIVDGRLDGSHLTFRLGEFELWAQWCALQTKTYVRFMNPQTGDPSYSCLPSLNNGMLNPNTYSCSQSAPNTLQMVPVDCGKLELCEFSTACQCSATGCERSTGPLEPNLYFDLMVAGTSADGTISGALGDHNVHFIRTQP